MFSVFPVRMEKALDHHYIFQSANGDSEIWKALCRPSTSPEALCKLNAQPLYHRDTVYLALKDLEIQWIQIYAGEVSIISFFL